MGFNSAFKGLMSTDTPHCCMKSGTPVR